jgi:hypothetical protein
LNDRSQLPGALDGWQRLSNRQQRRRIARFARAERHRTEVEVLLAETGLLEDWYEFPPTEQREILAGMDYLRYWPLGRRDLQHVVRAVERGSDYRRAAGG